MHAKYWSLIQTFQTNKKLELTRLNKQPHVKNEDTRAQYCKSISTKK